LYAPTISSAFCCIRAGTEWRRAIIAESEASASSVSSQSGAKQAVASALFVLITAVTLVQLPSGAKWPQ
jgi:hypothetical protein